MPQSSADAWTRDSLSPNPHTSWPYSGSSSTAAPCCRRLHPFQRHLLDNSAVSYLSPPPTPCQRQSLVCPALEYLCRRNTKLALGFGMLFPCSESLRILHLPPPCQKLTNALDTASISVWTGSSASRASHAARTSTPMHGPYPGSAIVAMPCSPNSLSSCYWR